MKRALSGDIRNSFERDFSSGLPDLLSLSFDPRSPKRSRENCNRYRVVLNQVAAQIGKQYPPFSLDITNSESQCAPDCEMCGELGKHLANNRLLSSAFEQSVCVHLSHFLSSESILHFFGQNMEEISIEHSLMENVPFRFTEMPHLLRLGLNRNCIESVDGIYFGNLRILSLAGNNIKSINLSLFPMLEQLMIAENLLETISIPSPVPCLQFMDLANNSLVTIPHNILMNCPSLNTLNLMNNHLTSDAVDCIFYSNHGQSLHLRNLNLEGNSLMRLPIFLANRFPFLQVVNLSHNCIDVLEKGSLSSVQTLVSLCRLDLSFNAITYLHVDAVLCLWTLSQLAETNNPIIHLNGNPWRCYPRPFDLQNAMNTDSLQDAIISIESGDMEITGERRGGFPTLYELCCLSVLRNRIQYVVSWIPWAVKRRLMVVLASQNVHECSCCKHHFFEALPGSSVFSVRFPPNFLNLLSVVDVTVTVLCKFCSVKCRRQMGM